jgi:predicted CoA-binding protein
VEEKVMPEKTVARKLMIKEGSSVLFVNAPKEYSSLLGALPKGVRVVKDLEEPVDFIQLFVDSKAELEAILGELKKWLLPKGILWVTYHKGTSTVKTDINRDSTAVFATSIGMQPVAMVSVDDDWSALRLKVK